MPMIAMPSLATTIAMMIMVMTKKGTSSDFET